MSVAFERVTRAGAAAPWLTMVHGMSQDRRVFSEQLGDFEDRFRILLIDLPGHGLSADVPGPFGHGEIAGHVLAALDEAEVSRTHYWGTHTGSAVGLLLAHRHRDRFRSLILEGAVLPGRAMKSVAAELQTAQEIARSDGIAAARKHWFETTEWFEVMRRRPRECRAEGHWAIVSEFPGRPWLAPGAPSAVSLSDEKLARLDLPVLLYNGENDLADFVEVADHLERLLPNARREIIPEAGGFPAWEFPGRVDDLVGSFLALQEGW